MFNENPLEIQNIDGNEQLYSMCKEFTELRKPYKMMGTKEGDSKSNALKIMVNTFYGANTNPYINYGDMATGLTITGVARYLLEHGINLIRKKYGEKSVVYCHTDGINTNVDIDCDWLTNRLRLVLEASIPNVDASFISLDKDTYKEGYWIQIGNYVLRNLDGSLTKHGPTMKASTRSRFYRNTLDRIIEGRLANKTTTLVEEVYDFDDLDMEEFLQRRRLNRKLSDYVSETDMMIKLAEQGESIGIKAKPMTTYEYYKTKDGYKIKELTGGKSELDVRYYWDIVSRLLDKFGLKHLVRKNPPLTILDKKQKSLMEFV